MALKRPVIYEYLDYRAFLCDMFHFRKQKDAYFSYRYFSRKAGFASPNFLKLVINGQRNLTNDSLAKVAKGFGLKKQEREFFENMVFMNQASNHEEKDHYYRRMSNARGYSDIRKLEKAGYEYFSKWYYPVIRELACFAGQNATPEVIAAALNPPITARQAETALALLQKLELIRKDDQGRWQQCDTSITTGPEVRSLVVANFHREMLRLATESIERYPARERDISALTLSVNQRSLPELKARIADFRRELLHFADQEDQPDQVVQVNIQLFPLGGVERGGKTQ